MNRIPIFVVALGIMLTVILIVAPAQARHHTLQWTAPGDDGTVGKARVYDLRYSRNPISESNFLSAVPMRAAIIPGPAGSGERVTIFGLQNGVPYYFALRTMDESRNWSSVSNVAYLGPFVEVEGLAPLQPAFSAPRPSPAHSSTTFAVTMPQPEQLRVEAFDITGRRVRTIAFGQYSGGTFDLKWDLRDDDGRMLQAGAYLVRGQFGENVFLRRVNVIH